MQFSLNEMGFPHEQWEQNIDVLSQSGYDGLEPNVTDDGPFWDDEETEKVASLVASAGLDVPAVSTTLHWEHSLSSPEETVRERAIEIGERILEVTDRIGAEAVLTVPAVVTSPTRRLVRHRSERTCRTQSSGSVDGKNSQPT